MPAPAPGTPAGEFEQPPVVKINELLAANMQSGPGFQVGQQVPTNGAMGQYTIVADPSVFRGNAGTYYIESLDMLKIRLSEIPAIAQLENLKETSVFAKALALSAERPVTDAAIWLCIRWIPLPGCPAGLANYLAGLVSAQGKLRRQPRILSEAGKPPVRPVAQRSLLWAMARFVVTWRENYTSILTLPNPILTKELNKVAWVMFSARMTVDAAMMAVPGSMIITGVEFSNDLVYQTPKADLILLVQKKLKNIGLSQEEIVAFSTNTAIPLSLQVTAVKDLEALGNIPGRRAAAVAIGNVVTECQARFLVTSLGMLGQWSQQRSPITRIRVPGVLVARDQNGTSIMPAPVDYVSWTPRIAGFATNPQLLGMQNRVLWITGKMTPRARQQLAANGWTLQEGAQL
jgi:hypothetical protein